MAISVHELTEYISWAPDDLLHLALADGTDGKITKSNIMAGMAVPGGLDVYYVKRSNNLSDIANPQIARNNLGLGSVAVMNEITKADIVDFDEADYATAAQGDLADSALQAGDNISVLVNDAGYIPSSQKGIAGGVAPLDANNHIPAIHLPASAITNTFVVNSEAEMLALDAHTGDVAIRNDESQSYILQGEDASSLSDWQWLRTPASGVSSVNGQIGDVTLDADDISDTTTTNKFVTSAMITKLAGIETGAQVNTVTSVNGQTGVVTLVKADVGLGSADDTSDLDKPISTATQAALDLKANATINIIAGTGLSGGGNLTTDRTLNVTYGSSAGTAAQGNDVRLSDSREWTADTVSQSEAETGTATTRRAWTAQRVRQAIVAWWNGSSDKSKLDGIDAGAEVNQDAFATVSVLGQDDVIADDATDTLTLVGGTGVNISTNASTNTITFEATGVGTGSIEEVIAGNGLTGGGTSSTVTLNVGAGTGINVSSTNVGLNTSDPRNVDHTAVAINAGTGLSGGGDLTAPRTLNVTYGSTAGTSAQGNDSRLSDSREWTASTVTQSEAETGTATTRRAWTAQRVRQAIVAWWNTVGTTLGKNLLNLTNPSAVRFLRVNADNSVSTLTASDFRTAIGAGTGNGSVTSVGMSVPTGLNVSGTPITASGTLAVTYQAGYQGYTTTEATKLSGIEANANNYILPAATATVLGGVELFSNTVQSAAANSVSNTAGRTYGVQLNSDGQAVVNVPWEDTNTTYTGSTSITLSGGSFQRAALTGDVTASANSNATTIANSAVTNAKMANMATNTIKGRSGSTGAPQDLTATQARTVLNVADGATANQTDAFLLSRANHTGTQTLSTISDAGGAAALNVGTTAGTVAAGNDSRLSNAREWTADTVGQAEAEARTATTRRAWTAQRVGQAIAAWWNTVGTTAGKAILNLANPSAVRFLRINADNTVSARSDSEMREDLGLGTAATATLTTSISDDTVGRVLRVGDFNIGRRLSLEANVDLNTKVEYGDFMISAIGVSNGPLTNVGGFLKVRFWTNAGVDRVLQTYETYATEQHNRVFTRRRIDATTWTDWVEFHNSERLPATTVGRNILNLANPSAERFLRIDANNSVSARSDSQMRGDLGLGSASTFDKATVSQAEQGVSDGTLMTPFLTHEVVNLFFDARRASQAEAEGGSNNITYMSPLRVQQWGNANAVLLSGTQTIAGAKSFTTGITAPSFVASGAGTPSNPSHRLSDSGLGMYRHALNTIGFATNGVLRALLSNTALTMSVPVVMSGTNSIQVPTSTAGNAPIRFGGSTDDSVFSPSSGSIVVRAGGADALTVTSSAVFVPTLVTGGVITTGSYSSTVSGSASSPIYAVGGSNTGMYSAGTNQIGWSTNGTNRVTVSNTAVTSTVEVVAPSFNTTSSLKYKADVTPFENALEKLMKIDVITYKRKLEDGEVEDKVRLGVSAESLAKVVPELVNFKDGEPDSVNYAQGFALCVKAIQEMMVGKEEQ